MHLLIIFSLSLLCSGQNDTTLDTGDSGPPPTSGVAPISIGAVPPSTGSSKDNVPNLLRGPSNPGGNVPIAAINTANNLINGGLLNGQFLLDNMGRLVDLVTLNEQGFGAARLCYQCSYSPPNSPAVRSYNNYYYQHGNVDSGNVTVEIPGGWDKCHGPFTYLQALRDGIDVWACHSHCYIRKDRQGNVFRGCFKGEHGVNPNRIGCHVQAGEVYCFCLGQICNNGPMPEIPL